MHHPTNDSRTTGPISLIMSVIDNTVDREPSSLPLIRGHFPRPRLLRALLDIAFAPNDVLLDHASSQSLPAEAKEIRESWMHVDTITSMGHIYGRCMRRGCSKKRSARCKACRLVDYCGSECQARYVRSSFQPQTARVESQFLSLTYLY